LEIAIDATNPRPRAQFSARGWRRTRLTRVVETRDSRHDSAVLLRSERSSQERLRLHVEQIRPQAYPTT